MILKPANCAGMKTGSCLTSRRKENEASMKTAVVYYSMSGNADYTAKSIAEGLDADLIEIRPEKAYPDKGFRKFFWGGKSAVMAEKPKLVPYAFDPDQYNQIVIGFPVWAGNMAPPIRSFVTEQKEAIWGKQVAAFACQSGSGGEKALQKLQELLDCPGYVASMILIDPKVKPKEENNLKIAEFREKLSGDG